MTADNKIEGVVRVVWVANDGDALIANRANLICSIAINSVNSKDLFQIRGRANKGVVV